MFRTNLFLKIAGYSVIVLIAIIAVGLAGCQKELNGNTVKDEIVSLSQKYGMNISFTDEVKSSLELSSLEELELVFKQIAEKRATGITRDIIHQQEPEVFLWLVMVIGFIKHEKDGKAL